MIADLERLPPHDEGAEKALLSCVLCGGKQTLSKLRVAADDFYATFNQNVYSTCLSLCIKGTAIDAVTVMAEMPDQRWGDKTTRDLLIDIVAFDAKPENADSYAKIVVERSKARRAIQIGHELTELGYSDMGRNGVVDHASALAADFARMFPPTAGKLIPTTTVTEIMQHKDEEGVLWPGVLVKGDVSLLTGLPKAGKGWLLAHFLAALARGDQFLGFKSLGRSVRSLWITEEGRASLQRTIRRFGITEPEIAFATRDKIQPGLPWAELLASGAVLCKEDSREFLVVDTVERWAGIGKDGYNDPALVVQTMKVAQDISSEYGIGILLVKHDKKSGGEHGTNVADSREWIGQAAGCVSVTRSGTEDGSHQRVLIYEGRLDPPLDKILVEHVPGEGTNHDFYRMLGTKSDVANTGSDTKIIEAVVALGAWVEKERLSDVSGVAVKTIENRGPRLALQGKLQRIGKGTKTDPLLYGSVGLQKPS